MPDHQENGSLPTLSRPRILRKDRVPRPERPDMTSARDVPRFSSRQMMMLPGVIERPNQATCDIPRGWLRAEEEVAGVVFAAGVPDIPGGDRQGIVPGAGNRAAGLHLTAAGDRPRMPRRSLLPAIRRCISPRAWPPRSRAPGSGSAGDRHTGCRHKRRAHEIPVSPGNARSGRSPGPAPGPPGQARARSPPSLAGRPSSAPVARGPASPSSIWPSCLLGCRTGRRMIAYFLRSGSRAKERPQVVEPVEFWSAPSASPTVRGMLLGWSRRMCRPRHGA
jgi:hypothetical protein